MTPENASWIFLKEINPDDIREQNRQAREAMERKQRPISNIMDDEESVMENNPDATNLVSSTGRLPGQEPPPQKPNPLDLSMDKLKGLQGEE